MTPITRTIIKSEHGLNVVQVSLPPRPNYNFYIVKPTPSNYTYRIDTPRYLHHNGFLYTHCDALGDVRTNGWYATIAEVDEVLELYATLHKQKATP